MREIRANINKTIESKNVSQCSGRKVFTASLNEIVKEASVVDREVHASLESLGIGTVPDTVAAQLKHATIGVIFNGNPGIRAKYASVKKDIESVDPEEFVFFRVRAIDACGFEKVAHSHPPAGNDEDLNGGANANADYFSVEQLLATRMHEGREVHAFETFVGCPFFTNHENTDIEKARGKIINAFYDLKNHCVFCDVMVDRKSYPKLGRGIEAGYMTDVSMGASVDYSLCSACGNKRHGENDCCEHIRNQKGRVHAGRKVYEINYGVKFIEISSVANGAFENCKVESIMDRSELSERLIAAASEIRTTFGNVPGIKKAVANIEKSGNLLSQANKLGSKEDLDKLYESLQSVKDVGKNILDRNDVDFSFMKDISLVMEHLQDVIINLDEAGFGNEATNQDENAQDNPQDMPQPGMEQMPAPDPNAMPQGPGMEQMPPPQDNSFGPTAGTNDLNMQKLALRNKLAQNWDKLTKRNSDSMKHNLSVEKNGYTLKVANNVVTAYHNGEFIAESQLEQMKPAVQAAFNTNAHDAALMVISAMENAPPVEDVLENQLGKMSGNYKRQNQDTPTTLEGQLDKIIASPESGFAEFLLNGKVTKTSRKTSERVGESGLELPVVESQIEDRRGDSNADVLERHLDSGKYNTKRENAPFEATLEGVLENDNGSWDTTVENQISARRQGSDAIKGNVLAETVKNIVVACSLTSKNHGISPAKVVSALTRHGKSGIVAVASTGSKMNEAKIAADVLGRIKNYDLSVVSAVIDNAKQNPTPFVNGIKAVIAKEAIYLSKVAADEEFGEVSEIEVEVTPESQIEEALQSILEIAQDAVDPDGDSDEDSDDLSDVEIDGDLDEEFESVDDEDCPPCDEGEVCPPCVSDSDSEVEVSVDGDKKEWTVAKVLLTAKDIGVSPKTKGFKKAVAYAVARQLTANYGKPALPNNVKVTRLRALKEGLIQVEAQVAKPAGKIEKLAGALWVKTVTAQTPPPMGTGFQDQFQQQSAPQGEPISTMNQDPAAAPAAPGAEAPMPEADSDSDSSIKFCPVCGGDEFEGDGNNKTCSNCDSDLLIQETVVIKSVGDGANDEDGEGEEMNDDMVPAMPAPPTPPAGGGFDEQQNQAITQASIRMHPYTLLKTANVVGRPLGRGEAGSLGSHCPNCGDGRTIMASSCGACAACGTSFKITASRIGYKLNAKISWRKNAFAGKLDVLRETYTSQAATLASASKKIIRTANASELLGEKEQRNLCARNLVAAGFAKKDALHIANASVIATALEEDDDAETKLNILDDGNSVETGPVILDDGIEGEDSDLDDSDDSSFDGFDAEDSEDSDDISDDMISEDSDVIDIDLSFNGNEVSFTLDPETKEITVDSDSDGDGEDEFTVELDEDIDEDSGDMDFDDVSSEDESILGDMDDAPEGEDGIVKDGELDEEVDGDDEDEDAGIKDALARANKFRQTSAKMSSQARAIAKAMGISDEELKVKARAYALGLDDMDKVQIGKSGYDGYFARIGLAANENQTQPLDAFESVSDIDVPRNAEVGAKDLGKLDDASKTPPEFAVNQAAKRTSGNPDGYAQNYVENVKPNKGRFKGANKKRRK